MKINCRLGLTMSFVLALSAIQAQVFSYQPIIYAPGDNLSTPFHAWLSFDHPLTTDFAFLNVRVTNDESGTTSWTVKNLPIAPDNTVRPIHYRMDLSDISATGPPESITVEATFGDYILDGTFAGEIVESLIALPVDHYVPTGAPRLSHSTLPYIPPLPIPPILPDTIEYLTRQCTVPNIDLDSLTYDDPQTGDNNACAPAAAANSLRWLMDVYPDEIFDVDDLRGILEEMKEWMMKDSTGVSWDKFVEGKLAFIDEWELPIRVKYQVHTPHPGFKPIIESPDSTYGHAAENETTPGGWPDFDWICDELKHGEDVEMGITYWCDSAGVLVQSTSHSVNLTGYFKFGNDMWLVWKHDTDQSGPGGTVEEFGRFCVDTAGYPFIKEMSETDGCIAYIGDVVSESYDSTILFEDILDYMWKYRPIDYAEGSVQQGENHHAFITFRLPFSSSIQFINLVICNPATGEKSWAIKNLPVLPASPDMPVRYKVDLESIAEGDSLPDPVIIKYSVTEHPQQNEDFPVQSYATLSACPEPVMVGDGIQPDQPPPPSPPPSESSSIPPDSVPVAVAGMIRGCEVPNIDLDSMTNDSDLNACGPAAAANSLQWLDDQHQEIEIPISLRNILDSLKKMMNHSCCDGIYWEDMVRGKLDFIDNYQLPIHVKYQARDSAPAVITAPDTSYGHTAENQAPQDPDNPGVYLSPTFDWLCSELEAGEDVELNFGFYCDSAYMAGDTLPNGDPVTSDTVLMTRKYGHSINVTGKVSVGDMKWITYKHDVYQDGPGGTTEDNTPGGQRFTDLSKWIESDGYVILEEENFTEDDGDKCRAIVEQVITESYDPDIEFCIEDVSLPDDSGKGSLRSALACASAGDTITLLSSLANDTIRLTSVPLIVDKDIVIVCDRTLEIYIEGQNVERVFEIAAGANVTLDGLRIICGDSEDAACVQNAGTAVFRNTEFYAHDGNQMSVEQIENTGVIRIEGKTNLNDD